MGRRKLRVEITENDRVLVRTPVQSIQDQTGKVFPARSLPSVERLEGWSREGLVVCYRFRGHLNAVGMEPTTSGPSLG